METAVLRTKEIHLAVEQASASLLTDMRHDAFSVNLLKDLGFSNAGNVKDHDDHVSGVDYALLYRQKYPFNKFITNHQLAKIREKYDLQEGELSRFKGDIPLRNITAMAHFSIEQGDIRKPRFSHTSDAFDTWMNVMRDDMFRSFGIPTSINGGTVEMTSGFAQASRAKVPQVKRNITFGPLRNEDIFARQAEERKKQIDERKKKEEERLKNLDSRKMTFAEINKEYPSALKITADKALFLAPDPMLDPIVTVAVNGGYLIVTAWGAEASDQDVVNPVMN